MPEDTVSLHEIAVRYAPRMPQFTVAARLPFAGGQRRWRERRNLPRESSREFMPGESFSQPDTPGGYRTGRKTLMHVRLIIFLMGISPAPLSIFSWAKNMDIDVPGAGVYFCV